MFVWKDKNKWKEARVGPFFKKQSNAFFTNQKVDGDYFKKEDDDDDDVEE